LQSKTDQHAPFISRPICKGNTTEKTGKNFELTILSIFVNLRKEAELTTQCEQLGDVQKSLETGMADTPNDQDRDSSRQTLRQGFIELLQQEFWESCPSDQNLESIEDLINRSERMP